MIRLGDKKFNESMKWLEKTNSATRREFFSVKSPDRFLLWWVYYYVDDFITPLADFHYDWIEYLLGDKDVMIEGFRWSIKTTVVSAVITYKICNGFCNFVTWQSYDDGASSRNTTQIAIKLLSTGLVKDYWKLFSLSWSKEDLQKKSVSDFDTTNWVKVLATSLGQKLRGALSRNERPDMLVLDDIDVSDSVRNPETISKNYNKITWETFGAMTKEGKSQIYFLGNTINKDWIVPRFREEKKDDKNWKIFHQPLILNEEIQWDFFTEDIIERIKSKEWLAFNQNYLLIPGDIYEDWLVKEDYLRFYEHINLDDFDELYAHADTTHTWKKTSDYFCLMILWKSKKDNNFYVIDFILKKLDVEKQARNSIVMYSQYSSKIKKFTYDEKANQWFWFWIKKLAKDEYNLSLPIEELKYPSDKVTHFEPHLPHFVANRVYLPSKHKDIHQAKLQLTSFPLKWVNDDFVDGLSGTLDNFSQEQQEFFTWFF